jgi:hypothetical protein
MYEYFLMTGGQKRQALSAAPSSIHPDTIPWHNCSGTARKKRSKRLDGDSVLMNTLAMSITPQALQDLLDELGASRSSRKRAWENLQEIRWVLKDTAGIELPPPGRKTLDLEGRLVNDGVRKATKDRQNVLTDLVHAIREYRKLAEKQPLTLQGADYAHAVQELNKAIDRAQGLLLQ